MREIIHLTRHIPYTKFWVLERIRPLLREPILDLGCGKGDPFWYLKFSGDITGVDVFFPYLKIAYDRNIYKELFLRDVEDIEDLGKFKTITAFFLLEHLPTDKTERLLNLMKRIGKTNIITIPYGKHSQEEHSGNPRQRHVSHYLPEFLEERGFEIMVFYQLSKRLRIWEKKIFAIRRNNN